MEDQSHFFTAVPASATTEELFNRAHPLWQLGFNTIKELETAQGILASGREEIYGCIFGRDSLITALRLLEIYQTAANPYFLSLVKKILENLYLLQGKTVNIESGEQPGKCIHEFRTANFEHLTAQLTPPWFLYEDKTMRNFDSVDATPLLLIASYRYSQVSGDSAFLEQHKQDIRLALNWIFTYGDSNADGFIDFQLPPERHSGGLVSQNWMDSTESLFHEDGSDIAFPMAPVEVQGYTYLALKLWARYFSFSDVPFAAQLDQRANTLKVLFNDKFPLANGGLAAAIDGRGKVLSSIRSSMGHCLWAALNLKLDNTQDSILNPSLVPQIISRLLQADLFEPQAGIRTLSSLSNHFNPASYHNGSIWPHDTSLIAQGLQNFGFHTEARQVRQALMQAWQHFQTPLELFVFHNGQYQDYCAGGQSSCKKQAWSAASLLLDSLAFSGE